MNKDLISKTKNLLEKVGIPRQPQVVLDLVDEVKRPETDYAKIAEILEKDIAMSAQVLSLCNAPFFGLRQKKNTIKEALAVIGVKNLKKCVLASALHDAFKNDRVQQNDFDAFFEHSLLIAQACQHVAKHIGTLDEDTGIDPDEAYLVGLFHDCAMPIISKKHPEYFTILREELKDKNHSMTAIEEQHFMTNHCIAGAFVTKAWKFSSLIYEPIRFHHGAKLSKQIPQKIRSMVSILKLSETMVYHEIHEEAEVADPYCFHFSSEKDLERVRIELGIGPEKFEDIREGINDIIHQV